MSPVKKAILLSFISAASFSSAFMSPMLYQIETMFQISSTMTQQLMSIFLVGYVTGQLIYGPLANSFGRINALKIGFATNIIGTIICVISVMTQQFNLLLLGRLITSLGASAGLVCTFILIREYFDPDEAKSVFAYAILSFTLGVGIAVFTGGVLIDVMGITGSFLMLMMHGVILFALTFLFSEPQRENTPFNMSTVIRGYFNAIRQKRLVYFSMVLALSSSINYCYTAAAPLIAVKDFHMSASQYGLWNGFNIAGMFLSAFIAKALLKHFSSKKVLLIAGFNLILCLLLLGFIDYRHIESPLIFFSVSMLLFVVAGIFFPAASDLATKSFEEDRGSASSIISFINMGMACLMVIVMSFLSLGYLTAMITTLGGYLLLLFVIALASMRQSLVHKTS